MYRRDLLQQTQVPEQNAEDKCQIPAQLTCPKTNLFTIYRSANSGLRSKVPKTTFVAEVRLTWTAPPGLPQNNPPAKMDRVGSAPRNRHRLGICLGDSALLGGSEPAVGGQVAQLTGVSYFRTESIACGSYVVALDLIRRVPSVNADGLILDKPW